MNPGPSYKRRRPAVACTECRRRKIRCNLVRPCGPCSSRSWPALRCVYNNGDKNKDNNDNDNENENDNDNTSSIYEGCLDDHIEQRGRGQLCHSQSILGLSSEIPDLENGDQNLDSFPFSMTPLRQGDAEAGFIDFGQEYSEAGFIDFGQEYFSVGCSHTKNMSGDLSTTIPSLYDESPTWTSMSSQSVRASSFIESKQHQKSSLNLDSGSSSVSGPGSELQLAAETSHSECDGHWYDVFAQCKVLRFLIHGIARRPLHDSSVSLQPLGPEQQSVQPLMETFVKLERVIQHERECRDLTKTSTWPPTAPSTPRAVRDLLPPRPVCDVLLDAYIHTFESVLRILHVPSFLRNYERFWACSASRSEVPDGPFECKLIVAIAIASCTFANLDVSLREQAGGWIAHGKQWLTLKMVQGSRPDLDMAQIACLLALARHTHHHHDDDSFPTDIAWLPGGHDLTRMAIQMGLHREPRIRSPGMSASEAEMRRRLWATMLELSLQLCLDQGLPAPLSPESYDCELPSNVPDEDIALVLKPSDCPAILFTESTLLVLLARTQRLRLRILHLANAPGAAKTYDDTHQLAAELNDACRADLEMLRRMGASNPTNFQIKLLEMFTRPFVLALHGRFADQATGKPAYYYSRRTRLEVATLLLEYPPLPMPTFAEDIVWDPDLTETTNQSDTVTSATSKSTTAGIRTNEHDAYAALRIYGHGHFALVQRQATAALCVDLIGELEENAFPILDSRSRQQLRDVLRSTVGVFECRMRESGGAHSVREFLFFSCADAYIVAMIQQGRIRSRSHDANGAITRAALKALAMCCKVMELPRHKACGCDRDIGPGNVSLGKGQSEEDVSMWIRDYLK